MEPKTGSFAWLELGTTDRKSAKDFYSSLLGWASEDMAMGPDMTYTIFRVSRGDVAGAYQLMKEQLDMHVPPHWMLYVSVLNADESAAKGGQARSQTDCGSLRYSECRAICRDTGSNGCVHQHLPSGKTSRHDRLWRHRRVVLGRSEHH